MSLNRKSGHITRRDFIKLSGLTVTGSLLAACASAATTPSPASTTAPTDQQAQPTEAPQATQAPEVTQPAEPTTAPEKAAAVELNYYFLAWGAMTDSQVVADELSKTTQDKINATLKLVPMDWSQFNDKLKLALAAGEPIDLMFTCNWANDFYGNVRNGNLVALDDLLPNNAPQYWKSIKPDIWNAARVKGKIYGAINEQIWANQNGFDIRKDIVEKLNYDTSTLKTLDDYTTFFKTIKEKIPDVYPTSWFSNTESPTWWAGMWKIDMLGGESGIYWDDPSLNLKAVYDFPEYKQAIDIARTWYTSEFLPAEPTTGEDFVANMKAGQYACVPINSAKPGRESEDKAKYGFEFINLPILAYSKPFVTTGTVVPTMTGIARTCKNQERAAQLLELFNTDVPFYNTMCKGVEGKHWVWVDKSKNVIGFPSGVTAQTSPYNPNTDWEFGNQFNAYYVDMAQAELDVWNVNKKLNDTAAISEAMGFALVQDPIETEIAQVTAADTELGIPLVQGRVDPAKGLQQYTDKVKAAGIEKIMAEVNKQLDDWKKTKA
jgi:putative aldouronate transport system substrate-binding protein